MSSVRLVRRRSGPPVARCLLGCPEASGLVLRAPWRGGQGWRRVVGRRRCQRGPLGAGRPSWPCVSLLGPLGMRRGVRRSCRRVRLALLVRVGRVVRVAVGWIVPCRGIGATRRGAGCVPMRGSVGRLGRRRRRIRRRVVLAWRVCTTGRRSGARPAFVTLRLRGALATCWRFLVLWRVGAPRQQGSGRAVGLKGMVCKGLKYL